MLSRNMAQARPGGLELELPRTAVRALDPSFGARLVARLRPRALDRALIDGADPASSPALAARAALLTSRSTRRGLADGLDLLLSRAQGTVRPRGVMPRRAPVLENAERIGELACLLRGPSPLYARGLAILNQLITDGSGPIYHAMDGAVLARELEQACAAVSGAAASRPRRRTPAGRRCRRS